jgi:hypothetical protein
MNRIALFTFLAVVSACSQTNKDHCGNRQGDLTCQQQDDGSHPICSSCEAANNGCVAADVELDESCHAETVADTSTSNGSDPTTDPTTSASQSTSQTTSPSTTMTTDDTQTTDPVTTTMTTSSEDTSTTDATSAETSSSTTTTDPVTTDPSESSSTGMENPCGNGVIDPGEPCEGEDLQGETCESQGTASGVLACNELCQFDLSGCMPLPTCGDGVLNGDEQCDGDDFSAANCDALNPGLYGSGDLSCNEDCTFDTSDCCIGVGNGCNANTNCCNGCAVALCL